MMGSWPLRWPKNSQLSAAWRRAADHMRHHPASSNQIVFQLPHGHPTPPHLITGLFSLPLLPITFRPVVIKRFEAIKRGDFHVRSLLVFTVSETTHLSSLLHESFRTRCALLFMISGTANAEDFSHFSCARG